MSTETGRAAANVRTMEYPRLGCATDTPFDSASRIRELEREQAERERIFASEIERVRREALKEGQETGQTEQAAWRARCEAALNTALGRFLSTRDDYLAKVEPEVVRLALAIAERILRREAQIDPLALAAPVRSALGRLAESTVVRLRVAAGQRETWGEMLRLMPTLPIRPEVVGDDAMDTGNVTLESEVGTVDLSLGAQIAEVERSFFARSEIGKTSGDVSVAGRQD